jgi:hypothetical protein
VTLGICDGVEFLSTYSNSDAALGTLDSPFFNVTTTVAGPAPSWGRGEPGGVVMAAEGNLAVRAVLLVTLTSVAWAVPTWTLATFGLPAVPKPVPETVTW